MATKNPIGQKRSKKSKKKTSTKTPTVPSLDILNQEAMHHAEAAALSYFHDFREAAKLGNDDADFTEVPSEVLCGLVANTLLSRSFSLRFDTSGRGLQVTPIPRGAVIGTPESLAKAIASGGWPIKDVALIAQAAVGALSRARTPAQST